MFSTPELLDALRLRWLRLLARFESPHEEKTRLFGEVAGHYLAPDRHYHNLAHVAYVLAVIDDLQPEADDLPTVELAAWFHDVIYDPRAKDNEARSAAYARDALHPLGIAADAVGRVERLVHLTRHHRVADGDRDGNVLVDADLAILGADEETYASYAHAIRREYAWVVDAAYRAGRCAVLRTFLDRPRIYGTPSLFRERETTARRNLAEEVHRLESLAGK
jgi:predicted metal-dependent HD superfamily phosphohydrolase